MILHKGIHPLKMLDNESARKKGVHDARKCLNGNARNGNLYVCRVYNVFVISKRVKSDF